MWNFCFVRRATHPRNERSVSTAVKCIRAENVFVPIAWVWSVVWHLVRYFDGESPGATTVTKKQ